MLEDKEDGGAAVDIPWPSMVQRFLGHRSCYIILTVHLFMNVHILSRSVVSDSLQPHGLQPDRLPCPWDSPGKNIGVARHAFFQACLFHAFPQPRIKPRSPALQADSLLSEPSGKNG